MSFNFIPLCGYGRLQQVMQAAEIAYAVSLKPHKPNISTDYLEYLGELKPDSKIAFSPLQKPGGLCDCLMKKPGFKTKPGDIVV
jgi:hypothetical protein